MSFSGQTLNHLINFNRGFKNRLKELVLFLIHLAIYRSIFDGCLKNQWNSKVEHHYNYTNVHVKLKCNTKCPSHFPFTMTDQQKSYDPWPSHSAPPPPFIPPTLRKTNDIDCLPKTSTVGSKKNFIWLITNYFWLSESAIYQWNNVKIY